MAEPRISQTSNLAPLDYVEDLFLLEQNDEWAVQPARYMTLETMAQISLPAVAR